MPPRVSVEVAASALEACKDLATAAVIALNASAKQQIANDAWRGDLRVAVSVKSNRVVVALVAGGKSEVLFAETLVEEENGAERQLRA